jgi:YHS domain-containing protein
VCWPVANDIEVRDHLEKEHDECGYCGQEFGPDEVVIERTLHGRNWRFCSEECYRDFVDASNFKDEDLDSKDVVADSDKSNDDI